MVAKAPKLRQVLTDETYEKVKSLLMDQVIKPGEHVSIDGLARTLKVSQTPIREALARLESDGLVVRKPLIGYSATPILTLGQLIELYEFRFVIESEAIEMATKRLTLENEKVLRMELGRIRKISMGITYSAYRDLVQHDTIFHQLILRQSGNTFLENAFIKSHCHLHLFRLNPTNQRNQTQALREHGEIGRAMSTRDPKKARSAMVKHLENSRDRMLATVFSYNEPS
jgi:DNA-binding GntR family transcriptional regulator